MRRMQLTGEVEMLEEPDALNLERQLREILHELQLKRCQVEEGREALHQAVLIQHELERALDSEKRNNEEMQAQLEIAMAAAHKWEEERSSLQQAASRHRLQLETTLQERDALRDQARAVQLENVKLQHAIDEQDRQLKCQLAYQENCVTRQNKLADSVRELRSQMQKLEEDYHRLQSSVEATKKLSSQVQLSAEHITFLHEKEKSKTASLERKIVALEVEIQKLQSEKNINNGLPYTDFQKTEIAQISAHELQSQLSAERDGNAQLQAALEDALRAQVHFQQLEENVSQQLSCVSSELSMKEKYISQLESDKACLCNEVAAIKKELKLMEEALMDKDASNKKTDAKNSETQTDIVIEKSEKGVMFQGTDESYSNKMALTIPEEQSAQTDGQHPGETSEKSNLPTSND
ncbi:golgin subfamily A member 8Q-like [Schistocerca gregaria]|uniref:golgin subfamily A member 8Q-like n=1 Tax=Schistocerca gregaria TaxID=7010 RepID=UPI00211E2F80|nr:golgin subfamily A member 8Q-like [Schistocerca gregaria]